MKNVKNLSLQCCNNNVFMNTCTHLKVISVVLYSVVIVVDVDLWTVIVIIIIIFIVTIVLNTLNPPIYVKTFIIP